MADIWKISIHVFAAPPGNAAAPPYMEGWLQPCNSHPHKPSTEDGNVTSGFSSCVCVCVCVASFAVHCFMNLALKVAFIATVIVLFAHCFGRSIGKFA